MTSETAFESTGAMKMDKLELSGFRLECPFGGQVACILMMLGARAHGRPRVKASEAEKNLNDAGDHRG